MMQGRINSYHDLCSRMVPDAFRSQIWRRTFVFLGNALAVVTIASTLFDMGAIVSFWGILATISFTMFWSAINAMGDKPDSLLDEREARIRDRAHRKAYVFATYVFFPVAVLLAAWWPESRGGMQLPWALTAAWLILWGVPSSIIAWQLPDDDDL